MTPAEEVVRTLDDLVRAGKVRYAARSDAPVWYVAQIAVNWVVNRPGVASVIVGATKLHQLEDNLGALDFEIPTELQERLDEVSQPEVRFPYTFFESTLQGMINGGATVGDKPISYRQPILTQGSRSGIPARENSET